MDSVGIWDVVFAQKPIAWNGMNAIWPWFTGVQHMQTAINLNVMAF